jgi:hypothetical protein
VAAGRVTVVPPGYALGAEPSAQLIHTKSRVLPGARIA